VINFLENNIDDGGTLVVPKFHKKINIFFEENVKLKKNLPFVIFDDDDVEQSLIKEAKRIPLKEVFFFFSFFS
jgi:hypothetical protein